MSFPAFTVPDDFPEAAYDSAVGGAQLKFSMRLDRDGRYREPGRLLEVREQCYSECLRIVAWAIPFMEAKVAKAKYQDLPPMRLLAKLEANLRDDFDVPHVFRSWILATVAEHFGWHLAESR
jgi:hypothetical protein